jgi:hypothetical protein
MTLCPLIKSLGEKDSVSCNKGWDKKTVLSAERQEENKVSACIWTRIKGPCFLRSGRNKIQFFCRRDRRIHCFLQKRQEIKRPVFSTGEAGKGNKSFLQ